MPKTTKKSVKKTARRSEVKEGGVPIERHPGSMRMKSGSAAAKKAASPDAKNMKLENQDGPNSFVILSDEYVVQVAHWVPGIDSEDGKCKRRPVACGVMNLGLDALMDDICWADDCPVCEVIADGWKTYDKGTPGREVVNKLLAAVSYHVPAIRIPEDKKTNPKSGDWTAVPVITDEARELRQAGWLRLTKAMYFKFEEAAVDFGDISGHACVIARAKDPKSGISSVKWVQFFEDSVNADGFDLPFEGASFNKDDASAASEAFRELLPDIISGKVKVQERY